MRAPRSKSLRPCDRARTLARLPSPPPKKPLKHIWLPDEILCLRHYRNHGSTWPECSTVMDACYQILVSANACRSAYLKYRDYEIRREEEGKMLVFCPPAREVVESRRREREKEREERDARKVVERVRRGEEEKMKKKKGRKEMEVHRWTEEEVNCVRHYRGIYGQSFEDVATALDSCCQVLVSGEAVKRLWKGLMVEEEEGRGEGVGGGDVVEK
ncbi:MAG: hypothetical protein M1835_001912 [Candelina submexicana]|nr:MAG: hypothetical protein M1835_001912 [Candelina submexicana]